MDLVQNGSEADYWKAKVLRLRGKEWIIQLGVVKAVVLLYKLLSTVTSAE
jgi:hypothetical protein